MTDATAVALSAIDKVIARDEIRDLLSRYSDGIDRCDEAALKTVFWPDGRCDYGSFAGNAWEFATGVIAALRDLRRTQHVIGNMVIDVQAPDRARGQTSVIAYHEMDDEQGRPIVRVVGGRYLDRFARRDGEWRIAERLYLMDWNQNQPGGSDFDGWIYGMLNKGERGPGDPSRGWFG